jgi:hypothetical protein
MIQLNESLKHLDLKDILITTLGIDEFKSRIGDDSEIITLSFMVTAKEAGEDLVTWLERGYEFIIDADISPGEVERGKYYVFAELNRRPSSPRKIMEILDDIDTLTGVKGEDWTLKIKSDKFPATRENIANNISLTSQDYKKENDKDLNEWREIAGIKTSKVYETDEDILNLQRQAGIN